MAINSFKFRTVLVLAPHTDDGELGCGGTIARLIEEGSIVHYAAFSTAEASVPDGFPKDILRTEVADATTSLGISKENVFLYSFEVRKLNYVRQEILEELVILRSRQNYDLVLMPCLHDIHQDHSTVATEGLRAFKTTTILGYELIWNNLSFQTTAFMRLERRHVEKKARCLKEYRSQSGKSYMSDEFVFGLAKTRGVQIGAPFAECFEVIRWVLG